MNDAMKNWYLKWFKYLIINLWIPQNLSLAIYLRNLNSSIISKLTKSKIGISNISREMIYEYCY